MNLNNLHFVINEYGGVHYDCDINGFHPVPLQCVGFVTNPIQVMKNIASLYSAEARRLKKEEEEKEEEAKRLEKKEKAQKTKA